MTPAVAVTPTLALTLTPTVAVTLTLTLTLNLSPTLSPTLALQAERGRLEQCAAALRARVAAAEQSNAQLAHGLEEERAESEALRWMDG